MTTISNLININRQIVTDFSKPSDQAKQSGPIQKPGQDLVIPFSFASEAQENALMKARLSMGLTKVDEGPTMRGWEDPPAGGLRQPSVPAPAPGSELEEKRPATGPLR